MNITRENIDALNAILTVKIEKQDYEEKVEQVLRDYRKKANIKGFRPGMAPIGMVKKMYGKSVLLDEINKMVSENLTKHLVDEKLDILGEPLPSMRQPSDVDIDAKEDFTFNFDIAFSPVIDLKLSKRDKITYYEIDVDDKMVNETIESHTSRYGKTDEGEIVNEKDLVKGKFEQLDQDDVVLEGGIVTEDSLFAVDRVEESNIRALVIGAKKGDIIDFEIKKAFSNPTDLAAMLRISKEVAEQLGGKFRFTVESITSHKPAEVNQELFDAVYGPGTVSSEKEYKEKIVAEIKESFASSSDYKFLLDVKEKLVEKANVTLPDEFLKRWLVAVNEELSTESVEKDYPLMKNDLVWQLIKNKLIDEQALKIDDVELLDFAKKSVLMQFQQYGLMHIPDEHLESYARKSLEKKDDHTKMVNRVYEQKILSYIKETMKVEPKEVSMNEFEGLFK
ncbi:MAG TPA: trigger factor [Marinilabiliales bacterium]|nr:MAG: trigger factor [Bacteroidetes bacterium GWC2_40_13]OFX75711.1 MAG: trigger factor [Bacteroidetes bacterium GWD2_40_43]OFX95016.1 MAG: trigger factor [Bacteroidetes bacterium GWE2_40_63]OFY23527.1 MAG: trigger factor [Bacteroidetes bacterium GWF2_40_13]OFZ29347.1 MAG: trigger factor [Bacteroidetes bacterium RIFOXYC2_FULL_40_12]HAM98580.1 trigger factor [Marinilabiliales bacterium]